MRVPTLVRRLYSLLMFLVVSVLGGVLSAGLFVPAAGIAAESGKAVALALNSLPEELKVGPPAEGSRVLMADGTVLTTFYDQYRKNIPLDQIAPIMRQAQVAIEDTRFYEHGPLDLRGTLRALVRSSSGNTQGGSTLTQQYAKLALLYDAAARNDVEGVEAAYNRTVSRKVLELRYAVALEKQLTKDQILERYLNIAFFGDRTYGVEAAAQHFFGVAAKDLSLPQAAMLAGIVRNPVTTNPVANAAAAEERMRNVLDRLAELGIITDQQRTEAKQFKFDKNKVQKIDPRGCVTSPYPHLCDYVENVLTRQVSALGADRQSRRNTLNQAGLTIYTEIDPRFQDAAQDAVSNFVAPTDPVDGILIMIQPGTGLIKAMAQSKYVMGADVAKGETFKNYSVSNEFNGVGGSEGGSTFKAFTLTAAVLKGLDPINFTIDSPSSMTFPRGTDFKGCVPNSTAVLTQAWPIDTAQSGSWNMYQGATYSSNTFFAQLEKEVGVCDTVKAAEALGLKRADGANLVTGILPNGKLISAINGNDYVDAEKPTFTLGNTKVTPLSLANSYATLAARGVRCDPIILKGISDAKGRTYAVPSANCTQAIAPEAADRVNDILHGPFSVEGTAEKAIIPGYLLSGKTGTQTNAPTILANAYTPDIAASAILTVDPKHPQAQANRPNPKVLPAISGLTVHGAAIQVSNGSGIGTFDSYGTKSGYTLRGQSGTEAGGSLLKPALMKVLPLLPKTKFVTPADSPYVGAETNADVSAIMMSRGIGAEQPVEEQAPPTTRAPAPVRRPTTTVTKTTKATATTTKAPATTTTAPPASTPPATTTTKPAPTPTNTKPGNQKTP
nr:penicillin-binding protein [Propionibacterium sp.]